MTDLVAAEWLKLRTTRLLRGIVPAAVVISMAAVAGSVLAADRSHIALGSSEGLGRVLPVTGTGAVLVLIAGILIAAGEYRHGTAADTFLTTPRRHRVVAAKLVVGAGVGAAAGTLTSSAVSRSPPSSTRSRAPPSPSTTPSCGSRWRERARMRPCSPCSASASARWYATRCWPSPARSLGSRSSSTSSSPGRHHRRAVLLACHRRRCPDGQIEVAPGQGQL